MTAHVGLCSMVFDKNETSSLFDNGTTGDMFLSLLYYLNMVASNATQLSDYVLSLTSSEGMLVLQHCTNS